MHRAGPGERGGASYGRSAVATAKWAACKSPASRREAGVKGRLAQLFGQTAPQGT